MTCAKRVVTCTIVTPAGLRFVGTNTCDAPQAICPRRGDEGYEKCLSICMQPFHAETAALLLAGEHARGAHAYVEGIGHACRQCQEALFAAGIAALTIGVAP